MIQAALDASVAWYQVCDELRSRTTGLSASNAVWIFPSLEAALIELSSLLADRERETGGVRTVAVYPRFVEPALETMASTLSSAGLDIRALPEKDFAAAETWIADLKSSCLLVAFCDNDRFSGRVRNTDAVIGSVFASGNKIPCLRISFESLAYRETKPKSFEMFINVQADGAAIVLMGDRFRLNPRMAPYSMTHAGFREFMSVHSMSAGRLERHRVEEFESKLPPQFRPMFTAGEPRLLDRSVWIVPSHDGSYMRDRILNIVARDFRDKKEIVQSGLATLSGCWGADAELSNRETYAFAIADERRQEWLRARGMAPYDLRGTMILSSRALEEIGISSWQRILSEAIS